MRKREEARFEIQTERKEGRRKKKGGFRKPQTHYRFCGWTDRKKIVYVSEEMENEVKKKSQHQKNYSISWSSCSFGENSRRGVQGRPIFGCSSSSNGSSNRATDSSSSSRRSEKPFLQRPLSISCCQNRLFFCFSPPPPPPPLRVNDGRKLSSSQFPSFLEQQMPDDVGMMMTMLLAAVRVIFFSG